MISMAATRISTVTWKASGRYLVAVNRLKKVSFSVECCFLSQERNRCNNNTRLG